MKSLVDRLLTRIAGRSGVFRRLLQNTSWLLGADVFALLLKVAQGFIVARVLGVTDYGVLALIVAFVAMAAQLIDFRVWETAIKFIIEQREAGRLEQARATVKLCYGIDLVSGFAAAGLVWGIAGFGAETFVKDSGAVEMIQLYGLSLVFSLPAGTSTALLRVADRFDWLAIKNVAVVAVRFIGVVAVLAMGGGVGEILIVFLAAAALDGVASFVLASRALEGLELARWWAAPFSALAGSRRRITAFLLQTNANALFKLVQREADVLLVGYFLPAADAGYYKLARQLTDVVRFPLVPLYSASFPEFSRMWERREVAELRALARKLVRLMVATAALAFIGLVALASPVVELLVGSEYLPAVPIIYWLAGASALEMVFALGHPFLLATDRISASLLAIATGVVVQLAVVFIWLPSEGVVIAGVAQLAFMVVWSSIVGLAVRRVLREVA